jgi:hypothetical protein
LTLAALTAFVITVFSQLAEACTRTRVGVPIPPELELERVYYLINTVGEQLQSECLDALDLSRRFRPKRYSCMPA